MCKLQQTPLLKTTEMYSVVWRPEVWNHGVGRSRLTPKTLEETPSLPLPAAGGSRHSLAYRCITLISASKDTWPSSSTSVSRFPSSYEDISHTELRMRPTPVWPYLNSLHPQWPYFPIRSHSQLPGFKTSSCLFEEHNPTYRILREGR